MPDEEPSQWIVPTKGAKTLPAIEILTGRGFITGKSGSGKSVLEGTPVYTENGRKPIEEVEQGEKVLSLNHHTYEQEFQEVQATLRHTDDDLLRITLEDGTELVGTEDHSFLTVQGQEVVPIRGSDIEEGTWMPLSRQLPSTQAIDEIDLAEYRGESNNLVVEDDVIQSGSRTEDRYLDLDFETGRVVGLYLAEGSFDSHLTIQISNVDEAVKERLGDWGFNAYERTCNMGFRPLALFLKAEFGAGADGKSLPNWVFDTPATFRAGLLSGYFDGDGTIGENDVTAISKSPALLAGLKELLRQFGVSATVRDKFVVHADRETRYRRLTVDSFAVDRFAEVVDLCVETKSIQLDALCERLENRATYNTKDMIPNFGPVLNTAAREQGWTERDSQLRADGASVHNLTRQQKAGRHTYNRLVDDLGIGGRAAAFGESDIQWKRVVSIEELDEERLVYDLDVRHNDNFVANGVFVHNSNTASVVAEELLDNSYNLLIVDTEGEYYGLKERYEILHVGADEFCDVQVTPNHAERLAEIALERNVPIILDVSDYLDAEEAQALIANVVEALYHKEKDARKPFLLMIEEMQEYLPQSGGRTELAELLERVAKRGRKRGLGMLGMSQRPSSVDKDFITQCDWMVWHRLTWKNDLDVVRNILGSAKADDIEDFETGEAYLMTDWDDAVERVTFKRKRTHDAGATPGLESYERPDLKSVSAELVAEITATNGGSLATESEAGSDVELTEEEQADLADAVETVAAETEAAFVDEAADDDPDVDVDIAAMDEAELREHAERLVRRNQILSDEVRELRTVLQEIDAPPMVADPEPTDSQPTGRTGPPAPTSDDRPARPASPRKPAPPQRPPVREGVAGTLVEFVEMLGYLTRSLAYRCRLAVYRLRSGSHDGTE